MKRFWPLIVPVVIAATVVVGACQRKPAENASRDQNEITVGYSRLRISLPIFVAKEHGIFKKHGLDATLVMYDTAQPLMQALVESQVEIAGYTALPITFNGMLRSKTELLFLTTMIEDQEHRISYLLRKVPAVGEPPAIRSIEDLNGKSIGILPTIAYKAWIQEIFRNHGEINAQIRPIAPAQQVLNLESGGVDALFTNDPAATSAIQAGIAELISPTVEVPANIMSPFPFGSFNVQKEWAEKNADVYRRLTKALNEAVVFVNNHPAEAKKAMKPYLPVAFRDDVDKYPDALYLTTGESTTEQFQEIADKYFEIGIIPSPLDLTGLIETEEY